MDNSSRTITNGVKLVGEAVLPGASLLMDGKFVEGAGHAVIGIGARLAFGPIGALLVAADSFSKSVAHKNLWDYTTPTPPSDRSAENAKETTVPAQAVATPQPTST